MAAKCWLLELLVPFIEEYPHETYERLFDDDRIAIREWIGELVTAVRDGNRTLRNALIDRAATSATAATTPTNTAEVISSSTTQKPTRSIFPVFPNLNMVK